MPKKILALHGYAMNREWFQSWLTAVEQPLAGKAQFVYPQAPLECPEAEVRSILKQFQATVPESRIGAGQNWCWYRATNDKPPNYVGLYETLDWMQAYVNAEGPFDGVIGWSQGAVLAAIMAAVQQNGEGYDFNLKWLVLCGGFLPGDKEIKPWFATPLMFPSLHVVGEKEPDFMQRRARDLYTAFHHADWLDTPLGHMMPVQYPEYMAHIATWIADRLNDPDSD